MIFKFNKECNQIYSLHFESQKEMCMTFLRYQEYYESDNPNFQFKKFTIEEYKNWYIQAKGKFSYCEDWAGFNFPVSIIHEVHELGIDDYNRYDSLMKGIAEYINEDSKGQASYLIGFFGKQKSALKHEMAHGLFYICEDYKNDIQQLFNSLSDNIKLGIKDTIMKAGYAESSVIDEFQAYIVDNWGKYIWRAKRRPKELINADKKVKEIYNKYKIILDKT